MSVFTSRVVRNLFGTDAMRTIFSDDTRIANYVKIEVALAQVEAQLGVIPGDAYRAIAEKAASFEIDWERYRIDVEAVGYPVMPFVEQLAEHCGAAGEYLHWGSTTRDITDTSFVMQVRDALAVLESDLHEVRRKLRALTRQHRSTLMIARTHGKHALPSTFGFRCAVWYSEVERQCARLAQLRTETLAGQFGGAIGTFAAVGSRGIDVQRALMHALGLQAAEIAWFASRDRVAQVVFGIASIAQSMASIAKTLTIMTRDELAEASEGGGEARGTSSAMPHKHNTVVPELVIVHGRMAAQQIPVVMESMVQDFERDWQGHFETIAVPQVFQHAHAAVTQMGVVLSGLVIHAERMRANLDISNGLVMAESVMMALAPKLGRKQAHHHVSRLCSVAMKEGRALGDVLRADAQTTQHLSEAELAHALEPRNYIGLAEQAVDNVLAAHAD
jgi:3-carboxy-cis,cis-muconate cycloisomerase